MAEAGSDARSVPLQHSLGHPARSDERLQSALHRMLGSGIRPQAKPHLRGNRLHHQPGRQAGNPRLHLHRRRAARPQARPHQPMRSASRLRVPVVHQRDAHRRGVRAGYDSRRELCARHQRRGLRGGHRRPPRQGNVRQGVPRHGAPARKRPALRRVMLLYQRQRKLHRQRGVLRLAHREGGSFRVGLHVHARWRRLAHLAYGARRPARAPLPLHPQDAREKAPVHA